MNKKKIIPVFLAFLFFGMSFSACDIAEKREKFLEQLREIPCSSEYALLTDYGYTTKTNSFAFRDLIIAEMKKDGITDKEDIGISCDIYYDGYVLFGVGYDGKYENSAFSQKYAFGYINFENSAVQVFYTETANGTSPYVANENYFIYGNPYNDNYYVLDRKTNTWIENVNDLTPYNIKHTEDVYVESGIEYTFHKNELYTVVDNKKQLFLELTLDYILQRSTEMQTIENIIQQTTAGSRDSVLEWMICENELFVVRESKVDLLGRGIVYPLVFKYTIETDSFEYIGCSEFHDLTAIVKY